MPSQIFIDLAKGLRRLDITFLKFKSRPAGNYTPRQLSMAAAYTMFCHAEIEIFLESWATKFVDLAQSQWVLRKASRPLVHLCTFHEGRNGLNSVPSKDIWNDLVQRSIIKQKSVISGNHGIKESNLCELLSPVGFDTRSIDSVLLADLSAFGSLRGHHAHNSHKAQVGMTFDPFDRRAKVLGLETLLGVLDAQFETYLAAA